MADRDELDEFIEEQNQDPDFKHAYDDATERARLRRELAAARSAMRMSQTDVAKCMGTTQSAVSEFEGGATDPHLSTLQRYARAVCGELRVAFVPDSPRAVEVPDSPRAVEVPDSPRAVEVPDSPRAVEVVLLRGWRPVPATVIMSRIAPSYPGLEGFTLNRDGKALAL